jgi:aspartyl-tRNA(Asn)/glutamyl-tRNA(Gln) amidotransferase subunit A
MTAAARAAAALAALGEDELHAFLAWEPARVAERAASVDGAVARAGAEGREAGPLAGVPVAVKDNMATLDHATTCGSRMLEGYRSPYEATAVRRLREAGAVVVGKTNLDEFAMGSSTENSAYGPSLNPHDRERVPGGSSGGSAVAVATGVVPAALGSDTGGSVRQPASFCGVVGLRPTYGRVSRYGLVAFASSLDQVGTLGRTVEDAAALLEAIAGHDPRDATSAERPAPRLVDRLDDGVDGLVVGVPTEYFPDDLDRGVRARCDAALDALAAAGAEPRPISLPHTDLAIPAYYLIAPAEASSNLARYDGVRFGYRAGAGTVDAMYEQTRGQGFGPEVQRRILLGTFALSVGYHDRFYGRAQEARRVIGRELASAFEEVDVVFTPTCPTPAFRLGERTGDPYAMYLADRFTVPASLAGIPAISVPIGTTEGLPVGGQIMGPRWAEGLVTRVGRVLESVLPHGPETGGAQ